MPEKDYDFDKFVRNRKAWVNPFPIIKEIVEFENDDGSDELCKDCEGNCCFLNQLIRTIIKPLYDFNLDGLEKLYENIDILKNNKKNMKDYIVHSNFIDTTDIWVMNSNWIRVYELNGKEIIGFACPMLNSKGRCSIYPNRPEICKNAYKDRKENEFYHCDFKLIAEMKEGKITRYQ